MAGGEDEAEEIVPDLLLDRVQFQAVLIPLEVPSDLFVLALERLATPDQVYSAVLRGPHEPGARPLRHPLGGPLLERCDKGVLCKLLGRPYVADDASQPGDQPGRLDAPDRFDHAMHLRGCRLAASLAARSASASWTYGESSFTCLRTRRPHGSRTSRRRRVPASAIRELRRPSAPARANTRPRALWSPRRARR